MVELVNEVEVAKDVLEDAFYIVAGAFVGRLLINFASKMIPQIAQLGNYALLFGGVLGVSAISGNRMIRSLFIGMAVSGAIGVVNNFMSPVFALGESIVSKATA